MLPRVLMISAYAEPEPIGSNRVVFAHALELKNRGYDVEILTWTKDSNWRGPVPDASSPRFAGRPCLTVERCGMRFHVVDLPPIWGERVLTDREWNAAVQWGRKLIATLRPAIVHQQFWQNLWWMMEAGIAEQVPTIYSLHDYGMGCLRTLLVKGDGSLCDGKVELSKCAECIYSGRNALGKINERVAQLPLASTVLSWAFGSNGRGPLARTGGLRLPVAERVQLNRDRCNRLIPQLAACIVANPLAGEFVAQFGVDQERIELLPWFHDLDDVSLPAPNAPTGELTLGFVGRVSPEKGLHILLEAVSQVKEPRPLRLRIAGTYDNEYGKALYARYGAQAGACRVEWLGWFAHADLPDFYAGIHAAVVPSTWYDNCPASLIEAVALGRPVLCSDVRSMTHIVKNGTNGVVFALGDAAALAGAIDKLLADPELIPQYARNARNVPSLQAYADRVAEIYRRILTKEHAS